MADREARHRFAVQVLGSGGPMHAGGRGNAAYLLWHGDRPLLALDMGGDTPAKLAAAGVMAGDISLILISHVHPDHVSGLPDFFWGEITSRRSKPLTVVGPPPATGFHDAQSLFEKFFSKAGAFPDMANLLIGEPFSTQFMVASVDGQTSYRSGAFSVASMSVNHGDVPALAYRIQVGDASIVFAGDQTMDDPMFVRFSKGADLLVAHAIASENARSKPLGRTVAAPSAIGLMAKQADIGRLILGHWLGAPNASENADLWSLNDIDGVVAEIKRVFDGETIIASDLDLHTIVDD